MKRFLPSTCLAALLLAPALRAQANDSRVLRLQQIVASYTKDNTFMGTVLVTSGDAVLLNKGYGQAVVEWNNANAPDVKFRLGSLTKQFTATLILLLQQDGKLRVADPISMYIADAPKAWEKITVLNLLNHTSGIPNFTDGKEFRPWSMNPHTNDEEFAFFKDRPLNFEPGTQFSYSNSNYEVLGAIAEKASGKKYGDLLRERILDPLGMHDTGLDVDGLILSKRAQGYSRGPKGLEDAVSESMSVPWAAGSMYSTTGDLLLWERGLFGGKILNAASLKQMTTSGKGNYGFGVFVRSEAGTAVVNHGGGIEGFNTDLSYVPEKKIAIVVLSNVDGGASGEIGSQLVKVMLGEPVVLLSERKEQAIAPEALARLVGTFQLKPTLAITFTVKGTQLFAQPTGQQKVPVFYEGIDAGHPRFFLKVVDAQIEFLPDATGKFSSLVLHQGGQNVNGKRQ